MKTPVRSVAAVLAGHVLFSAAAFAIFRISGADPLAPPSPFFLLWSTAAGTLFAASAGWLAAALAPRRPAAHAAVLAALLAVEALLSAVLHPPGSSTWSALAAAFVMAPACLAAGWWQER